MKSFFISIRRCCARKLLYMMKKAAEVRSVRNTEKSIWGAISRMSMGRNAEIDIAYV
ncbi:hypothetical protein D3C83_158780 [compost metagenome]